MNTGHYMNKNSWWNWFPICIWFGWYTDVPMNNEYWVVIFISKFLCQLTHYSLFLLKLELEMETSTLLVPNVQIHIHRTDTVISWANARATTRQTIYVKWQPLRMIPIQRMNGVRYQKMPACTWLHNTKPRTASISILNLFFVIRARVTFSYQLLSRNMRVSFICVEARTWVRERTY